MRRVILAIVATAAGLVLLLSFKTHTQGAAPGTSPAAALRTPTPGPGGSTAEHGHPEHGPGYRQSGRAAEHGGGEDRHRRGLANDLRPGPGTRHRQARQAQCRHRRGIPDRDTARLPDQLLRDPAAQRRGPSRGQRQDRHGLRRHLHLGRLRRLAAERPRQGHQPARRDEGRADRSRRDPAPGSAPPPHTAGRAVRPDCG